MANAQNIIDVEKLLLSCAQLDTLKRRKEIVLQIINMFKVDDALEFGRFVKQFPNNEDGQKTEDIVTRLCQLLERDRYIFHDYLQAVETAQHMQAEIGGLNSEIFPRFTAVMLLRQDAQNVRSAFNLSADNAPISNIFAFMHPLLEELPKEFERALKLNSARRLQKTFPHDPSVRGRFYLRTILSDVRPETAIDICDALFGNETVPDKKTIAVRTFAHHALRWAAVVVDQKTRKSHNLTSVPVAATCYRGLESWSGRTVDIASGFYNTATAASVLLTILAYVVPAEDHSKMANSTGITLQSLGLKP